MSIKLSINCVTYNHVKYIRQALDGFVMQKTNFPFEVLIHDDASTDGTADIIREYEAKYPDIIKPIYQTENQWSKGLPIGKTFNFPRIQGEYVAMCEGDDYWTDSLKLQKQVDFLDAHPECSMCFHTTEEIWENEPDRRGHIPNSKFYDGTQTIFDAEDLFRGLKWVATGSTVYRWVFHDKEKMDPWPKIIDGDTYLFFLHARHGKFGYIKDIMSVYRHHPTGIWQGRPLLKYLGKILYSRDLIDKMFDYKYHKLVCKWERDILLQAYRQSVAANDFDQFNALEMPIPRFLVQPPFTSVLRHILPDRDSGLRIKIFNHLAKALGCIFNIRWVEKIKKDDYSA